MEYADRAGLTLVGEHRMLGHGDSGKGNPFYPGFMHRFPDANLHEVLRDIHEFHPGVTLTDLYTTGLIVAFVKKEKPPPGTFAEYVSSRSASRTANGSNVGSA